MKSIKFIYLVVMTKYISKTISTHTYAVSEIIPFSTKGHLFFTDVPLVKTIV